MLYSIAKSIVRGVIFFLFRVRVKGLEKFPPSGPTIVYSNHKSLWDPVIIACVLERPVHYMAKVELFNYPIFGTLLKHLNAFPVKRGMADRAAIKRSLEILSEGKVLGIFPEGTRSKDGSLQDPEPGIALIAMKSKNVTLVPAFIKGDYKLFSPIYVIFGEPQKLNISEEKVRSETLKKISRELFMEVEKLIAL